MATTTPESNPTPDEKREPAKRSVLLNGVAFALLATGLVLSVSLLWRGFALVSEKGALGEDVCSAMFGTGCDATLLDPLSHQLGLPLAGWGIVYFATLLALLLLAWGVGEAFAKEAILAAFALSAVGVCTSLVLAGMMFFGSVPLCPMCLIIHGLNFVIAPIFMRTSGLTLKECLQELAKGGKYLIGGTPADPQASRWKAMGFVAVALVAVVSYQWVLIELARVDANRKTKIDPQQILAEFASASRQTIEITADDPQIGSPKSPIQIVVFSSFGCPACQRFSGVLQQLIQKYPEKFLIVYKHYPLAKSCNPVMKYDRFPYACEAAYVAEAAHRQGRFWAVHDLLFRPGFLLTEKSLQDVVRQSRLDTARLEKDQTADSVGRKVSRDIEQGRSLKVDATPTVFMNGKRVRSIRLEGMEIIIRQQLAAIRL